MTALERNVPDAERDEILAKACARNLPVEVSVVGKAELASLRSRLLRAGNPAERERVVIEVPTLSGGAVMVHPDEALDVLLMIGGQRYGFRSQVRDRGRMRLGDGVEVSTILLEYPVRIVKLQRRRFFRVKIPGLEPLAIQCIAKLQAGAGGAGSPEGDDGFARFEATAVDISSGGVALRVARKSSHFVKQGRRIALVFELEGYAAPVRLLAEVRHVRRVKETGGVVAGMQFVDWHKTLPGRKAINYITRYVVKRQREELKRKSGLE